MVAMAALQTAQRQPDAAALQAALSLAAEHTGEGELAILGDEVNAARAMLASMTVVEVADPPAQTPNAVELSTDVLTAATEGFAESRVVGSGGFGKVYTASTLAVLAVARHHSRVAVKRANAGLELQDLRKEVEILQACEHPHLLPLYAFCFDSAAPCLVRQTSRTI
jgi:soluble lytic murein transglycosylase-like protein